MEKNELKLRLQALKDKGFVPSLRRSDTGIGFTLETLLDLDENNLALPDLGEMELKSQRKSATNKVTLFTFNRGVWKLHQKNVIQKYGYIDTQSRPALYCDVSSVPNTQGLYLKASDQELKLCHVDGTVIAIWPAHRLLETFKAKMPALAIVYADSRFNSENKEEFWFNECHILTDPNIHNFMDLIEQNIVVINLRMHVKPDGSVRNHGTPFRIDGRFLSLCFADKEELIN
jgi:hypothetical protein